MKRFILALTLIIGLLAPKLTANAADKGQSAEITFAKMSHDFGNIKEADGRVSCEFEFTNTGKSPLVILSAVASCGCTKPTYTTEPIAPGGKGVIKVAYNPSGRPGEFSKDVKIRTNAKKGKRVNLRISGVVVPPEKK